MAGLFDFLSGLGNMLGAATYTRPQDIQAVRGLLPQSVDNTLANTLQSPAANDALGVLGMGPAVGAIKAYHASPYDFNQFDMSKIGTGEGAQAYGHGLYFAENPKVAETYRPTQWQPEYYLNGKNLTDLYQQAADSGDYGKAAVYERVLLHEPRARIEAYFSGEDDPQSKRALQVLKTLPDDLFAKPSGKMYEVNINAEPNQFLNWDAPVGGQNVSSQVAPLIQSAKKSFPGLSDQARGADFYRAYSDYRGNSPVAASDALKNAGVPGIQYFDQGSRAIGQGTHNYVLFDPRIIDILKKYGLLGTLGGAAGASALSQSDNQ